MASVGHHVGFRHPQYMSGLGGACRQILFAVNRHPLVQLILPKEG